MFRARILIFLAASMSLVAATGCSRWLQQQSLLNRTRARYYNLKAAGANSYHCTVHPDWPLFIDTANHFPQGQALADTPWHRYLQHVDLSFRAPLTGNSAVFWTEAAPPPPDKAAAAKQMEASFRKMIDGTLNALQANLNGTLLPAVSTSGMKRKGEGYTLTEQDLQNRITDITFDKDLKITHLATRGPAILAEIDSRYVESPKGLLLAEMDSNTRMGDEHGVSHTVIKISYADVNTFTVPSGMELDTSTGTIIRMQFTNCGVDK